MARTSTAKKVLMAVNVLVIIGLAGATGYLYMDNRDLKRVDSLTDEQKSAELVEEIETVFDLPDETPVVARVTDVEEFKATYASFDNAEQGDYLLFFRKNRLNILYRQDEKRVVKTADVVVPISIELIGSQEAIDDARAQLSEFGDQITITERVDTGITQSFVLDVEGAPNLTSQTSSIAELLEIDVGSTLPSSITPASQTEVVIAVADASETVETVPEVEQTQEP